MKDDASPLHSTPLLVRPLIAFTPLSLCEMKITRSHLPSSREITRTTDRSHVPPSSSPRRQTQSGRRERERAKAASCSVFLRPKRPTATTEARLSVLRSVGWEHTNYITNARAGGETEREKGGREGGRDEGTKAAATALARSLVRAAAADATAILARLSRLGGEDELVPGTFLNYRIS